MHNCNHIIAKSQEGCQMHHINIANKLLEHITPLTNEEKIATAQAHALLAAAEALQNKTPIQVWVCVELDDNDTPHVQGVAADQREAEEWCGGIELDRYLIPCTLGKIAGGKYGTDVRRANDMRYKHSPTGA
jgi:hypothetical protein